jgi:hypothetical protein
MPDSAQTRSSEPTRLSEFLKIRVNYRSSRSESRPRLLDTNKRRPLYFERRWW